MEMPKNITHTLLVHAGSYKDFLTKLTTEFPNQRIKYVKKVAIHYYILQIEDIGTVPSKKQELYNLPIMALREEFSNFIFFKNIKSYNNVLKRMCDCAHNPNAPYLLTQYMLTVFEKIRLGDLEDAKKIEIQTTNEANESCLTTYFNFESLKDDGYNKLFSISEIKVDDKIVNFVSQIKGFKWTIGIH